MLNDNVHATHHFVQHVDNYNFGTSTGLRELWRRTWLVVLSHCAQRCRRGVRSSIARCRVAGIGGPKAQITFQDVQKLWADCRGGWRQELSRSQQKFDSAERAPPPAHPARGLDSQSRPDNICDEYLPRTVLAR